MSDYHAAMNMLPSEEARLLEDHGIDRATAVAIRAEVVSAERKRNASRRLRQAVWDLMREFYDAAEHDRPSRARFATWLADLLSAAIVDQDEGDELDGSSVVEILRSELLIDRRREAALVHARRLRELEIEPESA